MAAGASSMREGHSSVKCLSLGVIKQLLLVLG
jgi:hypothetical protein